MGSISHSIRLYKVMLRFLSFFTWAVLTCSPLGMGQAAEFVFVVDTSGSMKKHRETATEAVLRDVRRIIGDTERMAQVGDRVHLWTFDSDVLERVNGELSGGDPEELIGQLKSKLQKIKSEGRTGLARPIIRALEEFASGTEPVSLFVYTDGKDSLSAAEQEKVRELHQQHFGDRLTNVIFVRFGRERWPKETEQLVQSIGGRIIKPTEKMALRLPARRAAPMAESSAPPAVETPSVLVGTTGATNNPAAATAPPGPSAVPGGSAPGVSAGAVLAATPVTNVVLAGVIRMSPATIVIPSQPRAELIHIAPVEFKVEPAQGGLTVAVAVEAAGWPDGMTISTVADRLATEGRQSIGLVIRNLQGGTNRARLKLSSTVPVEPAEVAVVIEVPRPEPERVTLQFSEPAEPLELTVTNRWQVVPGLVLNAMAIPAGVSNVAAHIRWHGPAAVEWRMAGGGTNDSGKLLSSPLKLGELGTKIQFQARLVQATKSDTNYTGELAVELDPDAWVRMDGKGRARTQIKWIAPFEVRVLTEGFDLGELTRATQRVERQLILTVEGDPTGRRLQLAREGAEGLGVTPVEFSLIPGRNTLKLEFSGWQNQVSGPFTGKLAVNLNGATNRLLAQIPISGRVAASPPVAAEVENPMVAGMPLRIRSRAPVGETIGLLASVTKPTGSQVNELALGDHGLAGDQAAADGVHTAEFNDTGALGVYRVIVSRKHEVGTTNAPVIEAPIYFAGPEKLVTGKIVKRDQPALLHLNFPVRSEFPNELGFRQETPTAGLAFDLNVTTRQVRLGTNEILVSLGLKPETQPGEHRFRIELVTDSIHGQLARIPVEFAIQVIPFSQYLMRLSAGALALAAGVVFIFLRPFRKGANPRL